MTAPSGMGAHSGLVYNVRGTIGHVADITEGNSLLHGECRIPDDHKGALLVAEEKHVAARYAVCTVAPLDDAPLLVGVAGVCASKNSGRKLREQQNCFQLGMKRQQLLPVWGKMPSCENDEAYGKPTVIDSDHS